MNERYTTPTHFMPLPELLSDAPGTYEIIDSRGIRGLPTNGMVDLVNQFMLVPLDAGGRTVSRHECAHVLWSPPRAPAVRGHPAFLQAVEDGRINRGLRFIGLGIDLDAAALAQVVELGRDDLTHGEEGLLQWALRTVASYGTNAETPLLSLIDENGGAELPLGPLPVPLSQRVREIVVQTGHKLERAREREEGPVGSQQSAPKIARWLRGELRKLGLPDPPKGSGRWVCCGGGGHLSTGGLPPAFLEAGRGAGPASGRMRISEPPLPHVCAPGLRGRARGRRSAPEGTVLRDISRFAHDQRVFLARAPRRRGGGSVLIDTSGSMSLDSHDIDQIIEAAPGATLVAIYSGRDVDGELRVVVRAGRRIGVEGLEPYGPGNVVDLPALEWLAKQPAPRVLISDGGFTGQGDSSSREIRRGCAKVCRRAGIVRVKDAAEAGKLMEAGR